MDTDQLSIVTLRSRQTPLHNKRKGVTSVTSVIVENVCSEYVIVFNPFRTTNTNIIRQLIPVDRTSWGHEDLAFHRVSLCMECE